MKVVEYCVTKIVQSSGHIYLFLPINMITKTTVLVQLATIQKHFPTRTRLFKESWREVGKRTRIGPDFKRLHHPERETGKVTMPKTSWIEAA